MPDWQLKPDPVSQMVVHVSLKVGTEVVVVVILVVVVAVVTMVVVVVTAVVVGIIVVGLDFTEPGGTGQIIDPSF